MTIPCVIDALRELAPVCPGGEAVLLEAAEHLKQMLARIPMGQDDPRLPIPEPQR